MYIVLFFYLYHLYFLDLETLKHFELFLPFVYQQNIYHKFSILFFFNKKLNE